MKKLLLLDADVIIDLHTLRLFNKMAKAYQIKVTRTVLGEVRYFPRGDKKIKINIEYQVEVIDDVSIESIRMATLEAKEAMLIVDPGETESIGYLIEDKEDIALCVLDKAAIKLMSYMDVEGKAISLETALRNAGHHTKLYPRHLESNFKKCVEDGKALRIQYKKLY